MLDINGTFLSDEDKLLIENKHVGGLILFSRNFQSFHQIKDLINEIKNIKDNIIIAVDQEGGRVQRFNIEFSKIPPMQKISNYVRANNDQMARRLGIKYFEVEFSLLLSMLNSGYINFYNFIISLIIRFIFRCSPIFLLKFFNKYFFRSKL